MRRTHSRTSIAATTAGAASAGRPNRRFLADAAAAGLALLVGAAPVAAQTPATDVFLVPLERLGDTWRLGRPGQLASLRCGARGLGGKRISCQSRKGGGSA